MRPDQTLFPSPATRNFTCLGLTFLCMISGVAAISHDQKLYQFLFADYNPLIRPVANITDTITIEFNLALSQIIFVVSQNSFDVIETSYNVIISIRRCSVYFVGPINQQQWFECLVEDLFETSKYSPLVRPVEQINATITVNISIQLSQIISVVSRNFYR